MSFRTNVFSGKELGIILGVSGIVSVILYVSYVTLR
ncbi:MAG: hypothetical protein MAG458_01376 [Nitrosopumilus sp.]|nr:hypothetical protein [Nitrosopumilus sp.]